MPQQLVVDVRTRAIVAVDNAERRTPLDFHQPTEGKIVPRLGSADLIRLAAGASDYGYHVIGLSLRDRSLAPLPGNLEDELSDQISEALESGDVADVGSLLSGVRGPYSVIMIHLARNDGDEDVWIGRLGEFWSDSTAAVAELISPAWKQLQLS